MVIYTVPQEPKECVVRRMGAGWWYNRRPRGRKDAVNGGR